MSRLSVEDACVGLLLMTKENLLVCVCDLFIENLIEPYCFLYLFLFLKLLLSIDVKNIGEYNKKEVRFFRICILDIKGNSVIFMGDSN